MLATVVVIVSYYIIVHYVTVSKDDIEASYR